MKKTITLIMLVLSIGAFSQSKNDQYSLEAGYGGSIPVGAFSSWQHFEGAFRYMVDDTWGLKFDMGYDAFRKDGIEGYGSNYLRFSAQAVHNLARTLGVRINSNESLNLLAHAGLGYSNLKSESKAGTDNIGNVIIGITPQVKLSRSLALYLDASYIANFSQNFNFNGTSNKGGFTGSLYNLSAGLTFYFGKNKGDSDWR